MVGDDVIGGESWKQVGKVVMPIAAPLLTGVAAHPLLLAVALGAAAVAGGVWLGHAITSAARA